MKCPYCNTGINLKSEDEKIYRTRSKRESETGIKIINNFCPECGEFIILLEKGKYRWIDDSAEIIDVSHEETVYPKFALRVLSNEIPLDYRDAFNEANSVVSISPKASAALSRRLLQEILRNKFNINEKDLFKEIDKFIERSDIPEDIKSSVDAIRIVGNFATHPLKYQNTGIIVDVEVGEAEWSLEVIEAIFDFAFVQPAMTQLRKNKLNSKLANLGKDAMK